MKNKELNNKNFLKSFEKEFFKFFLLKSQKFKKKMLVKINIKNEHHK